MEECPENLICFTEEELDEYGFVLDGNGEPIGDVEAASQLVWDILFLTPLELLYVGISMSILAFYGLSIFACIKWIQRKFSVLKKG